MNSQRAAQMRRWARRYLYPPAGVEVRRLIAILTLAVGLPRLPVLAELFSFATQRLLPPETFGVICTLTGVLLLATCHSDRRLALIGRLSAAVGFVVWVSLAAATTSTTSFLIDAAVAASLLVETGTLRRSHE